MERAVKGRNDKWWKEVEEEIHDIAGRKSALRPASLVIINNADKAYTAGAWFSRWLKTGQYMEPR